MEFALILYWYACVSAIETRPRETVAYQCEGRGRNGN